MIPLKKIRFTCFSKFLLLFILILALQELKTTWPCLIASGLFFFTSSRCIIYFPCFFWQRVISWGSSGFGWRNPWSKCVAFIFSFFFSWGFFLINYIHRLLQKLVYRVAVFNFLNKKQSNPHYFFNISNTLENSFLILIFDKIRRVFLLTWACLFDSFLCTCCWVWISLG
jgi:hypothetical protein